MKGEERGKQEKKIRIGKGKNQAMFDTSLMFPEKSSGPLDEIIFLLKRQGEDYKRIFTTFLDLSCLNSVSVFPCSHPFSYLILLCCFT